MSINKTDVNLTLLTAFKNSNFIIVGEKALQAANATKLQSESLLESDQTISGIKSISNIKEALEESIKDKKKIDYLILAAHGSRKGGMNFGEWLDTDNINSLQLK